MGVVICNDHGLIMAFLTQQISLPSSVIDAEVLAAQKALELTIELGFDNITLEGDSEVLIKSLVKIDNSLAHYGHLLVDIHVLMAWFSSIELGFDNITLEGDSEVLIKYLVKGDNSLAHYGHLLADIHVLMARFSWLHLSHVRRHCNSLAHTLA